MIKGTTKTGSRIAFVLLALGCGGRAETQIIAGAGAGEAVGGSPSIAVAGSGADGSTPIGAGDAGGSNGELGGAVGVAGAAAINYCGVILAAPTPPVAFAPTEVVWNRIQSFLGTATEIPPGVPVDSTPQLAGALADHALSSLNGAPAPGLASFVSAWWPGTPNADAWATLFGDPKATLTDLLTTTSVANPGSGVLTDPAVLKLDEITTRGEFLYEHLLCNPPLPFPPANLPPLGPKKPGQTRRQQLEQDVASPNCSECHRQVDPLGDSLEHYDTAGMFNLLDNGSPINSSGTLLPSFLRGENLGTGGAPGGAELLSFTDANDLGAQLANDCGVSLCLAQRLLAYAQITAKLAPAGSTDTQAVAEIAKASASGKLRDLIHAIVEGDTFLRAQ
jgi:hypothetical protein